MYYCNKDIALVGNEIYDLTWMLHIQCIWLDIYLVRWCVTSLAALAPLPCTGWHCTGYEALVEYGPILLQLGSVFNYPKITLHD